LEASIKTLSRLGFTVHFPRHSTEPEPFVHALWRFDNPVVVIPSKAIQSSFWHDLAVAIDHSPACFIIELMRGCRAGRERRLVAGRSLSNGLSSKLGAPKDMAAATANG
jgi:hypothetical protein